MKDLSQIQKEIDYYKRQIDELTAENFKLNQDRTRYRHQLKQKQSGFALLSELQQTIGGNQQIKSIFDIAISAINNSLYMESSVVLTTTDQAHVFQPTQWLGFEEDKARTFPSLLLEFPEDFSTKPGYIISNQNTKDTPLMIEIKDTFGFPFFVCVPVIMEKGPIGVLISGRSIEAEPLYPALDEGDVETFQAVAGLISASVRNLEVGVLQEMDRLKTQFFANLSHEFRTPITLTLGSLQGLLKERYGPITENVQNQARIMRRNQERLLGLINQILDLAKLEAGGMKLKAALMTNINQNIEKRIAQFEPVVEEKGLRLQLSLDPHANTADLYIDWEKFDTLIINLVSNAIKFTDEGNIGISTRIENNTFIFSVKDTGIGIRSDQIPYIFDRFRQADGSYSREYSGTGLGLTWVKEIATLHGGEVSVHSIYGKGTRFDVTLPLGKTHLDANSIVEHTNSESSGHLNPESMFIFSTERTNQHDRDQDYDISQAQFDEEKNTILYVDDNRDMQHYVRNLLEPFYNVLLASDGVEGVEKIKRNHPDLIITDYMMPKMTGLDLLKEVRHDQDFNSIPIVLLTAIAGSEARIQGLAAGADDYLTKPFGEEELLVRVKNILHAKEQERELAKEKKKSENLLLNILPRNIADLLKEEEQTIADYYDGASILFADIVGFTPLTEKLSPDEMIDLLNGIYSFFDSLVDKYGLEKIRTIGDNYMCASGVPIPCDDHAQRAADMALEMLLFGKQKPSKKGYNIKFRIGINSGPLVAGIIGKKKFHYDVWGDTVNTASRMESHGLPGKIQVSEKTYRILKDEFAFESRGIIDVKGKGKMETWFLKSRISD